MPLRRVGAPLKLLRKLAVITIFTRGPVNLFEKLWPLSLLRDPNLPLHAESESAVTVMLPKLVDGSQIRRRHVGDLGKVHPLAILRLFARQDAHESTVFIVRLFPLTRLEQGLERGVIDTHL